MTTRLLRTLTAVATLLCALAAHESIGQTRPSQALLDARLRKAVKANRLDEAKKLVSVGANVNCRPWPWAFPLNLAVDSSIGLGFDEAIENESAGYGAMVEFLLSAGARTEMADVEGVTPLMKAVQSGRPELVKILLAHGAEVNRRDARGRTAVLLCRAGDSFDTTFEILNAAHADLRVTDKARRTMLHEAVLANAARAVQILLDAGLSPNVADRDGITPFLEALRDNRPIMMLLLRGANVRSRDRHGATALMFAVRHRSRADVEILLERGVPIDERDHDGMTALMYAAESIESENVEFLIERGANVLARNHRGQTTLMLAAAQPFADPKLLELLVKRGVPVNAQDKSGKTGLTYAAQAANLAAVEYLLSHGADVCTRDHAGRTALQCAIGGPWTIDHGGPAAADVVVGALISAGADINIADKKGDTPLISASQRHLELKYLRTLLKAGAKVDVRNREGQSALAYYLRLGKKDEADELLRRGAQIGLVEAMMLRDDVIATTLLDRGADPNSRGPWGQSALMIAAEMSTADIVRRLTNAGARTEDRDAFGVSALLYAIGIPFQYYHGRDPKRDEKDVLRITRELLDAGADPNSRYSHWAAPISYALHEYPSAYRLLVERGGVMNASERVDALFGAVQSDNPAAIRAALDTGVDVNARINGGQTALIYAAYGLSRETIAYLLDHGANPLMKDSEGMTALDWAEFRERPEIANLIRARMNADRRK